MREPKTFPRTWAEIDQWVADGIREQYAYMERLFERYAARQRAKDDVALTSMEHPEQIVKMKTTKDA